MICEDNQRARPGARPCSALAAWAEAGSIWRMKHRISPLAATYNSGSQEINVMFSHDNPGFVITLLRAIRKSSGVHMAHLRGGHIPHPPRWRPPTRKAISRRPVSLMNSVTSGWTASFLGAFTTYLAAVSDRVLGLLINFVLGSALACVYAFCSPTRPWPSLVLALV